MSQLPNKPLSLGWPTIVVTSVFQPGAALRAIASGAATANYNLIVIGNANSPVDFTLPHCDYYDLDRQYAAGLRFPRLCPENHYARKNIGYLLAIRAGASLIVETDDDNIPRHVSGERVRWR